MLLSAALLLILAQQTAQPPQFKSGVNLVEVDVVVTDKAGRPVRGLRQEDFEVSEDGKPVPVATFVAVDLPQAPPDTTIPPADRSGTSIASNNQPQDGRVVLIVLDDYHVRFAGSQIVKTKAIARRLVERLGPSDQAAVVATSGRSVMQAEFTGDKGRLVEAIDKFFPQSEQQTSSGAAAESALQRSMQQKQGGGGFGFVSEIKARWAMETLSNGAKALAQIPHRRKAMLLVSEGLPASVEEIISNQNAAGAWQALRDFVLTAQRSNVAVYPVDPCGLGLECSTDAQQNLRTLAENTGGFAVVNTNAPEDSAERIVAENGTYYLLAYSSPAPPNDGRRHRIRVRTRVPDVEVRAREGYVSPRRATRPTEGLPLDLLIGAPIQTRGLTMRVAAVPAPIGSSPGSTIVLGIEIPASVAISAAKIEFSAVAIDTAGKVRARQRFSNTFEATGSTPHGSAPTGWARLRTHLPVAPGRYQVRIAAVAANKTTQGSIFTEVTVPKFDGDVAVGGLALVSPTPGAVLDEKHMSGLLALTPLATSEVPATIPIAAHVPIRVASKAAPGQLTIRTTLVGPDGRSAQLDNSQGAAVEYTKPSGDLYRIALPADLKPGAYRLVVNASVGRAGVTRELAFRVVPVQ